MIRLSNLGTSGGFRSGGEVIRGCDVRALSEASASGEATTRFSPLVEVSLPA